MAAIAWGLAADWEDDLVDLLGWIAVTGIDSKQITENCTNVDTFLAGLATIAIELEEDRCTTARVDLVVEPDLLVGNLLASGDLELSYGDQRVRYGSREKFELDLKKAISDFLAFIPRTADHGVSSFVKMQQFLVR